MKQRLWCNASPASLFEHQHILTSHLKNHERNEGDSLKSKDCFFFRTEKTGAQRQWKSMRDVGCFSDTHTTVVTQNCSLHSVLLIRWITDAEEIRSRNWKSREKRKNYARRRGYKLKSGRIFQRRIKWMNESPSSVEFSLRFCREISFFQWMTDWTTCTHLFSRMLLCK